MSVGQGGTPAGTRGNRPGSRETRAVHRVTVEAEGPRVRPRRDELVVEEPLEIRVGTTGGAALPVVVTMRTPGSDFELAAGFLYDEGVLERPDQLRFLRYCVPEDGGEQQYNVVSADLAPDAAFDPDRLRRNFYATSSCGVCGKASIEAVLGPLCTRVAGTLRVTPEVLLRLPSALRGRQALFQRTGGLHAAATFTAAGELLAQREDVGRHNAMDKLVGAAFLAGELPLEGRMVLVSGRLSFELVQKAARAGAELVAGISAPSSLAVRLAEETGVTLVGFLRENSFNVYAAPQRVAVPA